MDLQSKLLRVLQEGTYERIGDDKTLHTDVRIIAATNRQLKEEVERNRFRQDLYYRLNVFPMEVPPLRSRREDIPSVSLPSTEVGIREVKTSVSPPDTSDMCRSFRNIIGPAMFESYKM